MIRWFARNDIASNFLIIAILLWGGYSAMERVPLEVQPALVFKQVDINVPYRGGSPDDVEKAVLIPIESALEGLQGVKQIVSDARNGRGHVRVMVKEGTDPKELMEEIKTRVSRITTFPRRPNRRKSTSRTAHVVRRDQDRGRRRNGRDRPAARGAAGARRPDRNARHFPGPDPGVSPVGDLHRGGSDAAARLRTDLRRPQRGNPALVARSAGRPDPDRRGQPDDPLEGPGLCAQDFENIVISNRDGSEVSLGKVATISDGFEENRKILRFNGTPCLLVEALRLNDENALEIAAGESLRRHRPRAVSGRHQPAYLGRLVRGAGRAGSARCSAACCRAACWCSSCSGCSCGRASPSGSRSASRFPSPAVSS
jgi:hypothetical protein